MSCNIIFQNFEGTCYPGSTISGYVVCMFRSNTSIRGVKVKLRGKEHTAWWETETYTTYENTGNRNRRAVTRTRSVHYTGTNKFLAVDQNLTGKTTMASGRYEYPFSFTLPNHLPGNFSGDYGYISYYIKANVDIPYALDYEDEKRFYVNAAIDFNEIRSQLQLIPTLYQDEKTLCCCCCASGPITLDLYLQKEAFVVGEVAKMKIEIKNMSNESIDSIHLKLKTLIIFTTTSPRTRHRYYTENLASMSETGVGAHGQRVYEIDFKIPNTAAVYNFNRCSLFQQSFSLGVEASIPGLHSNMKVKTSVMLGHVPLRDTRNETFQQTPYPSSAIVYGLPPPPPYSPYPGPSMEPNSSIAKATAPLGESVPSAPTKEEVSEGMINHGMDHGRW